MFHGRHNNQDPRETGNVILFVDDINTCYYNSDDENGRVWRLDDTLPQVPQFVVDFAAEYFGVDADEACELCNPEDIVDNAGAWDDAQFVSELWQEFEDRLGIGFATPDGAVVVDPASVTIADVTAQYEELA
ncbi:hypothetical protein [Rubinisphaera brasiliensis]|uniref:Uncharacterized protein n=1 Tax=Rubinisphaera brasiliensis (strain ATCC 49424 / DSM 5305 / JCM 21570 / IAM 15109 / NBRC 103401 / IFAM 1448) TaxID=756272 RepID=F0SPG9_RUBBR|nr:hypothetical protein [Rubinisphaera brasiliensis]ADY57873.1 hypothetical protein Plabr_0244 [Rubinisphaera brasiliensis DSM 5305]